MSNNLPLTIQRQITHLTTLLIDAGITEKESFSIEKRTDSKIIIDIADKQDSTIFLKEHVAYDELYEEINRLSAYNLKMPDGALIRFQYQFTNNEQLEKSRLTFFPSPKLLAYDDNIDYYKEDSIYSDIVKLNIYPVPIRFDFDLGSAVDMDHPVSHLTLGQYNNCRIPVSSPLTPYQFCDFIMRNFYHSFYKQKLEGNVLYNHMSNVKLDLTITEQEKNLRHIQVYK